MNNDYNEPFGPEELDEQIDAAARRLQSKPAWAMPRPDLRLIEDMQRAYPAEDAATEQALARVRRRLARSDPRFSAGQRSSRSGQPDYRSPSGALPPRMPPGGRQGKRFSARIVTLAAAVLLVAVVGSLTVGLILVRHNQPGANSQTSTPGGPAGTGTPAAAPTATPASLDQQSVYSASQDGALFALNARSGKLRWNDQTDGLPEVGAPPLTLDHGILYIGTQKGVEAVKASDGSMLWFAPTGLSQDGPFVSNGVVYIGASEGLSALNASTGKLLWSQTTDPGYVVQEVADGIVYEGVNAIRAFDASTGKLLWKMDSPPGTFWGAVNGQVYVYTNGTAGMSPSGPTLYVFNARDGSARWQFGNGVEVTILGVVNNVVYLNTDDVTAPRLYALNANDGSVLWQLPLNTEIIRSALFDGMIYTGNGNGTVTAVSASDGTQRWQAPVAAENIIVYLLGEANGTLYILYDQNNQDNAGQVAALNTSDGSLRWTIKLGSAFPILTGAANGVIYLITDDNVTAPTIRALSTSDGSLLWQYARASLESQTLIG